MLRNLGFSTRRNERCKRLAKLVVGVCVVISLLFLVQVQVGGPGKVPDSHLNQILPRRRLYFDDSSCVEKQHVMFLKLEKTGGDTAGAVLARFGLRRNLSFAIPIGGLKNDNHFPRASLLPEMIVPIWNRPNTKYDILFRHSIYNRTTVRNSFPNGTVTMVIVRHPYLRFLSSFDYFSKRYLRLLPEATQASSDKRLQVATFLERFYEKFKSQPQPATGNWFLNFASLRFGIPWKHTHDKEFVRTFLDNILPDFKLALLNEYYDESMVLMKRRLCWRTEDIVYISVHVKAAFTRDPGLHTPEMLRQHKEMAPAEYLIYDRLSEQFWGQVHEEGRDFWLEVQEFKSVLRRFQTFCLQNDGDSRKLLTVLKTRWHEDIMFDVKDCENLGMDLDAFTIKMRKIYTRT